VDDVVIHAERLSKRYSISGGPRPGATLRDAVSVGVRAAGRRVAAGFRHGPTAANGESTIWALRDLSFDIDPGEVVGIIGRNGAGKSTLLKILSRITEPTSGRARVSGRVGSLLEVGTGFHPELSGRENIFLSGSILGMRRREIESRFDAIVEFSEIGRFLDTPVKRYSSGMAVRLGFAVAAHLEPEILLVDEVLAVGDLAFQKKCLGKMGDVAREGRTVLFVSHNMAVIQALCERGIFIDAGRLHTDAPIMESVGAYLRTLENAAAADLSARTDRRGWHQISLERVQVSGPGGSAILATGAPARFAFHTTGSRPSMSCRFTILNQLGHPIAECSSVVPSDEDVVDPELGDCLVCEIDELPLVPGRYRLDAELRAAGLQQDAIEMAAVFDVEQGTLDGRPISAHRDAGDVAIRHRWILPA
jgi:lipopolysaccharide transport system ATP-binding protein